MVGPFAFFGISLTLVFDTLSLFSLQSLAGSLCLRCSSHILRIASRIEPPVAEVVDNDETKDETQVADDHHLEDELAKATLRSQANFNLLVN